ncbi:ATP-binding protein [Streptomyces sp. RB6PN25]|uniref:ATP-binding protein n=1 Tax=Streptomyces humicola TaxID=2953240 RepID=A0ABT1PZL9_9ACTN|nr:ATP-binding protein [Streptomyces humicola]MCQ4083117.1 ATP-binding protein [Streptomyces humicola]
MDRRPEARTERAERGGGIPVPDRGPHTTTTEATAGPSGRELRHRLRRADLPAVAEVRRLLRDQLHSWGASGLADTAELLTSELVTNALVHTDRGAELTATLSGGPVHRLRVEVYDFVTRHPKMRKASDQAASGRGLLLVQALADAWGVRPHGVGKIVWFELVATGGS